MRIALGLLVAVGLVVAQLASLGHLALVRHVQCEHGALVHAGHAAEPAGPSVAPRADERGPSAAPGGREAEHDHCDGLALVPAIVAVDATCVVPTVLPAIEDAFRAHAAPVDPAVALLALAPKASPPA